MSQRHTLITSFLYANASEPEDVNELINALETNFESVYPHWTKFGQLSWIVMFSRDSNGVEGARWLAETIPKLNGIMVSGFDIVAAWDGAPEGTQVVWPVEGRGNMSRLDWIEAHS